MELKKILKGVTVLNATDIKNVNILNVSIKSNGELFNGLYVALKGEKFDGHKFLDEAKRSGAIAFVVEKFNPSFDGLQILVKDCRSALSFIAKNFYQVDDSIIFIGVTGTNGKTTTTHMVKSILECSGASVGLIGTQGIIYGGEEHNIHMTTPDPLELFKYVKDMQDRGIKYVVMEVSAHAIYYKKVDAINFAVKALTNITEDHLDFFINLESYVKTKLDFITSGGGVKVINLDDSYAKNIKSDLPLISYSTELGSADVQAKNISGNTNFILAFKDEEIKVSSNLIGKFNVENMLCAGAICKQIGINSCFIKEGLSKFKAVDGRLNLYKKGNKNIVIDFAHTPDALEKILKTIKSINKNQTYCVFGCGGNRDKEKRPLMGLISTNLANKVIFTNDNPRFEEPLEILAQIESGACVNNYEICPDRTEAIARAEKLLSDGDYLVICGKGAEDYMEIRGIKYPYSDESTIEELGYKRVN